jgi:hypothetical protein
MATLDTAETPSITLEEVANDGSDLTNPNADHRRLFLGEDGALHLKDSAGSVTAIGGGSASLTYQQAGLGADVDIPTPGTFADGPSVTLSAGTWLLCGVVTVTAAGGVAGKFYAKMWDGTTVGSSAQGHSNESTGTGTMPIALPPYVAVVASGTPVWKISVTADGAGPDIKAAMNANGAGNNASRIVAVKIA